MEALNQLVGQIGGFAWGPVMIFFLVGTGVLLTLAVALLSYHLFELRFLRLKRFFRPGSKQESGRARSIRRPRPVNGRV